ncbi:IS110 family transposase (plasmid) [Alicyclobacillus dauci]|uniref:IS110 family transposase n=1 Tax=Alicyclobacillus dauci TaxID=1475485 RepID=A0ABY6Z9C8_9BACL|nr:transposase [Alicyclobacillus dauci]WAH39437.1 IS110 family transposase [Alicyclobacillus dauci]
MSKLHVGIDVSLRSHHVQLMDGSGQDLASFNVDNNQPGADTLIRRVLETTVAKQMDSVVIGMEATSNLGWHLAHYLQQQFDGYRPNLDTHIHVLNARKVARFKKGYDTLPKTTASMPG